MIRIAGFVAALLALGGCCNCLRDVKDLEWASPPRQNAVPDFAWGPAPSTMQRGVAWRTSTTVPGKAAYLTGWHATDDPPEAVATGVLAKVENSGGPRFASPFRALVWSLAELPSLQLVAYAVNDAVLVKKRQSDRLTRHIVPGATALSRVQFIRFTSAGQLHALVRHRLPDADGGVNRLGRWTYEVLDLHHEQWAPPRPLSECGSAGSDGFRPSNVQIFEVNDRGGAIIGPCPSGLIVRGSDGEFRIVQTARYAFAHFNAAGDELALYKPAIPRTEIEVRRFPDFSLRHTVTVDGSIRHVGRLLHENVMAESANAQGVRSLRRLDPFRKSIEPLVSPKPALQLAGSLPLTQANFLLLFSGPGAPLVVVETTDGGKTWTEGKL